MDQKSSKAGRGESTPATEMFKCCGPNCGNSGAAEEMFNTSCDPVATDRAKILAEKVRCRECAEKISAERGKRLREPGCGVYPLARTLAKMTEQDSVSAKRMDTIRWVEAKIAEKAAVRREEDRRQRIEDSRLTREDAVRSYAKRYLEMSYDADPRQLPAEKRDEQGDLVCGLPLGCCRHDRPAERFITVFGEVVGICRLAASLFTETFKESGDGSERSRRLLSTNDRESAEYYAAKWSGGEKEEK